MVHTWWTVVKWCTPGAHLVHTWWTAYPSITLIPFYHHINPSIYFTSITMSIPHRFYLYPSIYSISSPHLSLYLFYLYLYIYTSIHSISISTSITLYIQYLHPHICHSIYSLYLLTPHEPLLCYNELWLIREAWASACIEHSCYSSPVCESS